MSEVVKCLLVDDLPENLLALSELLRQDHVEILEARSGTEALGSLVNGGIVQVVGSMGKSIPVRIFDSGAAVRSRLNAEPGADASGPRAA